MLRHTKQRAYLEAVQRAETVHRGEAQGSTGIQPQAVDVLARRQTAQQLCTRVRRGGVCQATMGEHTSRNTGADKPHDAHAGE